MWICLRSAHSLYLFFAAWFVLAGTDRGIRQSTSSFNLSQVSHRQSHRTRDEFCALILFSLYKHLFSTHTLHDDDRHPLSFFSNMDCNGMENHTTAGHSVSRLPRRGCLNSRMGVRLRAAFAFVPLHGCS
ncbi:hypothetical protein GGR50DRAFT_144214 [Xylaria sp. CBS 124048]|nr:hypothetical protein GGR50DRAFT_144214 [Xylaria sp. CBS 124048]